ncbi:MAG: hypothetical protein ABJF25_19980, partial [Rhodopirellula bahusiensis]
MITQVIQHDRPAGRDVLTQGIFNGLLAFVSGELENLQIHLVRDAINVTRAKPIVSDPKVAAREHLFAITVVSERTRFSNQRIDHVSVVDARGLLADESLHRLNERSLMSHRDGFSGNSRVDLAANQTTGNRVRVGTNVDRRAFTDANSLLRVVGVEPCCGQPTKRHSFFFKPFRTTRVGLFNGRLHERHVVVSAGEVATAAKQQRLIDSIFEVSVERFDIPVLVGAPGVGLLRRTAVVLHQCRVSRRQCR